MFEQKNMRFLTTVLVLGWKKTTHVLVLAEKPPACFGETQKRVAVCLHGSQQTKTKFGKPPKRVFAFFYFRSSANKPKRSILGDAQKRIAVFFTPGPKSQQLHEQFRAKPKSALFCLRASEPPKKTINSAGRPKTHCCVLPKSQQTHKQFRAKPKNALFCFYLRASEPPKQTLNSAKRLKTHCCVFTPGPQSHQNK